MTDQRVSETGVPGGEDRYMAKDDQGLHRRCQPGLLMTSGAVAPHLERWSSLSRLWQPLIFGATLIAASAGLALSLIGLPKAIEALASGSTLTRGPLPALACACFGFTVWGNYE